MSSDAHPPGRNVPQPCLVTRFNHFDPLWRRCWDRDFNDAGRRFVSYRAIEEAWIDDAIASCADGVSCFMVEASWVLRHYLERHPEHIATLRQLLCEGRFELLGAGENIVDSNMVHGELLIRNLMLGTRWAEETLGVRSTSGWCLDAFGTSAQLPQIFRGCGYRWIAALIYVVPDAPYWRGLDGSTIYVNLEKDGPFSDQYAMPGFGKHPPCPSCSGMGCDACSGRGFRDGTRAEFIRPPTERLPVRLSLLRLYGEEILPGFHVAEAVARFNAETDEFAVRQGTYRDAQAYITDLLDLVDDPPQEQISSRVENNPVFTGCYVTRIRIKQEHRAAEQALLAAERWDTLLTGGIHADLLRQAWRRMTLSAFHDSITSTHCDQAYDELHDLLAEVKSSAATIAIAASDRVITPAAGMFTLFNHTQHPATVPVTITVPDAWDGAQVVAEGHSLPVYEMTPGEGQTAIRFLAEDIPAFGAKTVRISRTPARVEPLTGSTISHGRYAVTMSEHGITRVEVDGIGAVVDPKNYLFGELVLEVDYGHPWATSLPDRPRTRLSSFTRLKDIQAHGDSTVITFTGEMKQNDDPMVSQLKWQQRYLLREGLPWLEVETAVDWYTHSKRLRLAFPTVTTQNRGVYEIPYGVLERDRYEFASETGFEAEGEWPAVHWAGIQAPDYTYAIMNRGTPSYRVEDGTVFTSILRSPQLPFGLLDPASYVTTNYSGMMDHGSHTFRHALYIGRGHWTENDTVKQAALYNADLLIRPGQLCGTLPGWQLQAQRTQLSSIKAAEDGRGIIVRLVDMSPVQETVHLRVPGNFGTAVLTNLLEEDLTPLKRDGGDFLVEMESWKIVTIRFTA